MGHNIHQNETNLNLMRKVDNTEQNAIQQNDMQQNDIQ